jgi:hypothetical protein
VSALLPRVTPIVEKLDVIRKQAENFEVAGVVGVEESGVLLKTAR